MTGLTASGHDDTPAAGAGATVPVDPRRLDGPGRHLRWVLLVASLLGVAALTLSPAGTGWAWGAPLAEVRWYAGASDEASRQLLGNLLLLVPSAVAAVLLRPDAPRVPRLLWTALAAGSTIELLQWTLPLGRVVSPVDALLNAVGAVVAARLLEGLLGRTGRPCG